MNQRRPPTADCPPAATGAGGAASGYGAVTDICGNVRPSPTDNELACRDRRQPTADSRPATTGTPGVLRGLQPQACTADICSHHFPAGADYSLIAGVGCQSEHRVDGRPPGGVGKQMRHGGARSNLVWVDFPLHGPPALRCSLAPDLRTQAGKKNIEGCTLWAGVGLNMECACGSFR